MINYELPLQLSALGPVMKISHLNATFSTILISFSKYQLIFEGVFYHFFLLGNPI